MSVHTVRIPALASVCALPLPMTPAPITPTLTSSATVSSSSREFAPAPGEQPLAQGGGIVASGIGRDRLAEMAQRAAHLGTGAAAEDLHHLAAAERERRLRRILDRRERAVDRAAQRREPLARRRALAAHRDLRLAQRGQPRQERRGAPDQAA